MRRRSTISKRIMILLREREHLEADVQKQMVDVEVRALGWALGDKTEANEGVVKPLPLWELARKCANQVDEVPY
jgi:hypothetical protein